MSIQPLLSRADRDILLGIPFEDSDCSTLDEFLKAYAFDSIVPCICPMCETIYHLEPDQARGWCPRCETNTMVSALVLAGVI